MKPLKVLFICVANTCRSPMAEAIARHLGRGEIEAFSAGLYPTGRVAMGSLQALEELGYPVDGLTSKALEDVPVEEMDVVVSLIGREGLRFLPAQLGAELESWSIRDPYGEDQSVYLATARLIEREVKALVRDLTVRELRIP